MMRRMLKVGLRLISTDIEDGNIRTLTEYGETCLEFRPPCCSYSYSVQPGASLCTVFLALIARNHDVKLGFASILLQACITVPYNRRLNIKAGEATVPGCLHRLVGYRAPLNRH